MVYVEPHLKEVFEYVKDKNVVIIGNSKSILQNKKDIDSYDIVVRLTSGYPKVEYKEYVGTRTDIWFWIGIKEFKFEQYIDKFNSKYTIGRLEGHKYKEAPIFLPFPVKYRNDLKEVTYLKYTDVPFYKRPLKNQHPTSGMCCVYLFLYWNNYKSLTLYGFDGYRSLEHITRDNIVVGPVHNAVVEQRWFDEIYNDRVKYRLEMPEYNYI